MMQTLIFFFMFKIEPFLTPTSGCQRQSPTSPPPPSVYGNGDLYEESDWKVVVVHREIPCRRRTALETG